MDGDAFFELKPYHVALAAIGAGIILAYWLPRLFSGREPAASALLILAGVGIGVVVPGLPEEVDPRNAPVLWEALSELAVIVALFGTGLRIDNIASYRRWRPTVRLLVVLMPLSILAVAALGWWLAGMTLAGALLLGAVLAPTDPVLAGDVQVGPPTEGGEHPVRFALTTEAGLNDGLTFPFVYLGLIIAAEGLDPTQWGLDWLARDVAYRIVVGSVAGAAAGWLLGRAMFAYPPRNALAQTSSGVLGLAGVLFCYGATELVEGYGFIAVFVAGLTLRRLEVRHAFHGTLHGFNEAIEHALTALLLVLTGGVLPILWSELDWRHAAIALSLVLVIRPVCGWISLAGAGLQPGERAVVAVYGVRGIGSIYYLGYAAAHVELADEGPLWATVTLTILLSTVVHGLSAGAVMEWVTARRDDAPAGVSPPPAPAPAESASSAPPQRGGATRADNP